MHANSAVAFGVTLAIFPSKGRDEQVRLLGGVELNALFGADPSTKTS